MEGFNFNDFVTNGFNLAGKFLDARNGGSKPATTPAPAPQPAASGLPSWLLPVAVVGGVVVLLFVFLRR